MDKSNKKIKKYINALQQRPVPPGSMLPIQPTNWLLLAAEQEPYKKADLLRKKYWRIFWKKVQKNGLAGRKR